MVEEKKSIDFDDMDFKNKAVTVIVTILIIVGIVLVVKFLYPNSSTPKYFDQMDGTEDPYWSP